MAEEAQLIVSVLEGDIDKFYELVEPYQKLLFCMVLPMLKNDADAEDAVQDALLAALRNLHRFRSESLFSTWLVAIALNEARKTLRFRKRVSVESIGLDSDSDPVTKALLCPQPHPGQLLEQMEMRDLLMRTIRELHPMYRDVVDPTTTHELSIGILAEQLGLTVGVVKTRRHRARKFLKHRLLAIISGRA